ncbi:unnamed protein product [Bemisia tabaci]|uniref:Folylpolyglutamate synthase n=1 Tax=Bemisia tabaci TaxID=7038 RepID=A0A9P0A1Z8_BEMTA|nr:unnamed protein product [Bemisia tabaci]
MNNNERSFQDVLKLLNTLQTRVGREDASLANGHKVRLEKLWRMNAFLDRVGVSVETLDKNLSVIHVAGSKGKGSTCAYCESILRHHGFKTGFFSSPHLLSVQERIRIGGKPISAAKFSEYFMDVYNKLHTGNADEAGLPTYFQALTVMAFYVFLKEKVDVAILEVGLGGVHDCTNVLNNVPVVGITSLQLEHTDRLGNTLSEIAWNKAGIMKPGCMAFTTNGQAAEALDVLKETATEVDCVLVEVPPLSEYSSKGDIDIHLGIPGSVQSLNASLAVQLSKAWLNRNSNEYKSRLEKGVLDLSINETIASGLRNCQWPGRNQTVIQNNIRYYLDGAHTPESVALCVEWYLNSIKLDSNNNIKRGLIFNSIGNRDAASMLAPLIQCDFDFVLFCPNICYSDPDDQPESLKNLLCSVDQMMARCNKHMKVWSQLPASDNSASIIKVLPSVSDSFKFIKQQSTSTESNVTYHVLVTGSLHLIGNAINVLDPGLAS